MFEDELPAWVNTMSPRVAAGLGTVPRVVGAGEMIYRGRLVFEDARARVHQCWHPYHSALRDSLAAALDRFAACLLVDCHSMPTNTAAARQTPDIVLGDAYGTTCAQPVVIRLEELLRAEGFNVRRNEPYAGGYITRSYGRPREHLHAVQIEILRPLYMDEARIEKLPGFPEIAARLARVTATLLAEALDLLGAR
jgi:N-formylglutamate deformylase